MEDLSSQANRIDHIKEAQEVHQKGAAEVLEKAKQESEGLFFNISRRNVEKIKEMLLATNVKERLLAMDGRRRKHTFQSWEFAGAIALLLKENPDKLKESLLTLFKSKELVDDFFGDLQGPQKLAISLVYNHSTGPEIMKELVMPKVQEGKLILQRMSTLVKLVKAITKPLDETTEQKLWELFRFPEQPKQLNEAERKTLQKVEEYLLRKEGKAVWDKKHLVSIIRNEEGRELFAKALKQGKIDELKNLLVKYVKAVEEAMETPEGLNTVGYLFTLKEGKALVSKLIQHPLVVWRLLKKQMSYKGKVGDAALERFLKESNLRP